jgi:hypothetical protein
MEELSKKKDHKDNVKITFEDSEEENRGLNRLKYEVNEPFMQFKF